MFSSTGKGFTNSSLAVFLKYSLFILIIVQLFLFLSQHLKRLINGLFQVSIDTHFTVAHLLVYFIFLTLPFFCLIKLLLSHKGMNIVWKLVYFTFAIFMSFYGINNF